MNKKYYIIKYWEDVEDQGLSMSISLDSKEVYSENFKITFENIEDIKRYCFEVAKSHNYTPAALEDTMAMRKLKERLEKEKREKIKKELKNKFGAIVGGFEWGALEEELKNKFGAIVGGFEWDYEGGETLEFYVDRQYPIWIDIDPWRFSWEDEHLVSDNTWKVLDFLDKELKMTN